MIVKKSAAAEIDFDGLRILDFTAGLESLSSSMALIQIPPGGDHRETWSKRSDKYYLAVRGTVQFMLGGLERDLDAGDFCLVRQGEKFSYRNLSGSPAELVLVHTPPFDLDCEVFADSH